MNSISNLHQVTIDIYKLVERGFPKNGRETFVTKVNQLLTKRDKIMANIAQSNNEEEEQLIKEIIMYNNYIYNYLNEGLRDIKNDIHLVNLKKKNNQKYADSYKSFMTDGMFLDKRN